MLTPQQKKEFLTQTDRDEDDFLSDLSQIIDVLQTLVGSETYVSLFPGIKYQHNVPCDDILSNPAERNYSHVLFKSFRGSLEGHFHFIHKDEWMCTDSYAMGWQRPQSNGFCQTFALMGALGYGDRFKNKSWPECSRLACLFILSNQDKWKRRWKTVCKNKGYVNIRNLSMEEVEIDVLTSMLWTRRGGATLFWKAVNDEVVYNV